MSKLVSSNTKNEITSKRMSRIKNLFGSQTGILYVFLVLFFSLFLLCDVIKINNNSGTSIFLTQANLLNVMNQISINAIIAFGMTFAILTLGIDLSVGSIVAIAGVSSAMLLQNFGLPVVVVVPIVLIIGLFIGYLNGAIIAKIEIPPFVVTLASMTIFRGLALLMVDGKPITIMDPGLRFLGNGKVFGIIPSPIVILVIFFAIYYIILSKTVFGRYAYVIGGNEEAAKLSGINVVRVKTWIYMIVGFACGMSGIVLAARLGSGQPNIGSGYELDAIAATIVGGTSFSGGVGTIPGTLIGCLIIGIINNGMNLLGVSSYLQFIVKGLVILMAVILEKRNRK